MSEHQDRRSFIQSTGGSIAGLVTGAAALSATSARAAGANERLRVALVGCGGRGRTVAGAFAARDDVDLAYITDCHQDRLAAASKT